MKALIPWLLVAFLAAGVGIQYSSNQKQTAELEKLRADGQELEKLRASAGGAPGGQGQSQVEGQSEELVRLRKEHDDLLRLRNEVRQLRDEKAQLARQAQAATKTTTADAQQQQQLAQLQAENQQLKTASQQAQQTAQTAACIQNLRQIDQAKAQWAQLNQRPNGGLVSPQDLQPLLRGQVPTCPAGGVYTLNPIGLAPICNIPGHVIGNTGADAEFRKRYGLEAPRTGEGVPTAPK